MNEKTITYPVSVRCCHPTCSPDIASPASGAGAEQISLELPCACQDTANTVTSTPAQQQLGYPRQGSVLACKDTWPRV